MSGSVEDYDKYLHLMTGGLCVWIGYLLIRSMRRGPGLSAGVCAAAACGFSCVVSVVWEVFEFLADYYIADCCNQNWGYQMGERHFFLRVLGAGAGNPGQSFVVDTDLDMVTHFACCLAAALVLYVILKTSERRRAADAEQTPDVPKTTEEELLL